MHPGGTGADHHAGEAVLFDGVFDQVLPRFGAHVLVVGGEDHAGLVLQHFSDLLHVDRAGDVTAAPTYEYADSLHFVLSSLLRVFAERADDGLLGQILVQQVRDVLRL